jgi:hypothetical protein
VLVAQQRSKRLLKMFEDLGKQDVLNGLWARTTSTSRRRIDWQIKEQTEFKPFTVTTPTGTGSISSSGALNLGLTPEQQAMQQQLFGFTTGAFDVLGSLRAKSSRTSKCLVC